jgi:hypothetical protein
MCVDNPQDAAAVHADGYPTIFVIPFGLMFFTPFDLR